LKIQIMSDIHKDQRGDIPQFSREADAIVIAGDIANNGKGVDKFFNMVDNSVKVPVIVVLGNHDYYSYRYNSFVKAVEDYKEMASKYSNIHILARETLEIDGVNFIGATLWTDYDKGRGISTAISAMPCFRYLRVDDRLVNYQDILDEYNKDVAFIGNSLSNSLKNVVITHHVPTFNHIPNKYKNNRLNGSFCTNLDDFIMDNQPDVWVCGHTHTNFTGQMGECTLYCNPWGYSFEKQTGYLENFMIEV